MGLTVYILKCSDGSYYTGVTSNLEIRIYQHQTGYDPDSYTYSRRPVEIAWHQSFQGKLDAIMWEKRIKGWSRKKKEALINEKFELLPKLSSCKNKSSHLNAPEKSKIKKPK